MGAGRRPWRRRPQHRLQVNPKAVVGLWPPLKALMPARCRLSAPGRAVSPASTSRPGPCGHAKTNPGQAVVPQGAVPAPAGLASPRLAGGSPAHSKL
ncbi:hypothetical protein COO59_06065 [Mixta theicola]|uniref:Uncharacterized protein n=1 Tax=Mixta theicola TaxID=1458355 RepID=A0A2K1QCB7_9GAMM|nr:hypothetical protein COO59_06065 [Mixta theicola]